ncbi:hypothetical protein HanXRQr2_Chr17g0822401 [Helianthus annuus]|uniref:Uncharacterized protein n=1 Tax=Helianthus annuus TaxID=4232 RepID=A0A9K3DMP6_HELAN|nr:hypothetical protein HanXRQr2_Chr17g0822401 [Helianthus annuus]
MVDQSRPDTGYPTTTTTGHATATAYPYVTPLPQNPYFHITNNPYYNPYAPPPRATTFDHRFFAFLIGIILITGVIIFIMWLVIRPQIPQFLIETLTLTNFNVSSNSLVSGNWDAWFVATNPNSKIVLYYDEIEPEVPTPSAPTPHLSLICR